MVFLLIGNISQHPIELLLSKTDHAETALPLQNLAALAPVEFKGTGAFQITDQIADADEWFDIDGEMDMGFSPADAVEVDALGAAAAPAEEVVDEGFQS